MRGSALGMGVEVECGCVCGVVLTCQQLLLEGSLRPTLGHPPAHTHTQQRMHGVNREGKREGGREGGEGDPRPGWIEVPQVLAEHLIC